jgi:transcriptional regulator with XRE-family HTH domain
VVLLEHPQLLQILLGRHGAHALARGPQVAREDALLGAQLAERAGVARIERDEIEPRMTTLRKLANGLEVNPAELVGD